MVVVFIAFDDPQKVVPFDAGIPLQLLPYLCLGFLKMALLNQGFHLRESSGGLLRSRVSQADKKNEQ